MMSASIRNSVLLLMVLVFSIYFILNSYKFGEAGRQFSEILEGQTAQRVIVSVDGELVLEQRVAASEKFDVKGQRQINVVRITSEQFSRLSTAGSKIKVEIDGVSAQIKSTESGKWFVAELPKIKLFLVRQDALETLAGLYWQQQKNNKDVVECFGAKLCSAIRITSRDWRGVEGPYLDTDLNKQRRGLPRGRWANGPDTVVKIESRRKAKIAVLINMYGAVADQNVGFSGGLNGTLLSRRAVPVNSATVNLGGTTFYPKAALVEMQLSPGVNELIIKYTSWKKISLKNRFPVAAYLTGFKVKEIQ